MKHDQLEEPRLGAECIGMPERQTPEVKALNKLMRQSLSPAERKARRDRLLHIVSETTHVVLIATVFTSLLIIMGAI